MDLPFAKEFCDTLCLKRPVKLPETCVCAKSFSLEHALPALQLLGHEPLQCATANSEDGAEIFGGRIGSVHSLMFGFLKPFAWFF